MRNLKKTCYTVSAPIDSKIVLISDIHYYNGKMKNILDKIIAQTKILVPDYICIPGDFIDERTIYDEEVFLQFLTELSIICPVVISIGNHDVKNKIDKREHRNKHLFSCIENIKNIHFLDNTSWTSGKLCFTGLTLPWYSYQEKIDSYHKTLSTLHKHYPMGLEKKRKYNIVLSHSPFTLLHPKVITHKLYEDTNLILSGHTHGGLTPTFLLNLTKRAFITPKRHLFPKYAYGYIRDKKTIVSSGITKLSHVNPFKFLNFLYNGEIVIISLKKEES